MDSILHLQRTIGNQAVQRLLKANSDEVKGDASNTIETTRFGHDSSRIPVYARTPAMIQPKLTFTTPGDIHEQQVNCIADQVMHMPESQMQRACASGGECPKCKQEKGDHEQVQTKPVQKHEIGHATVLPPFQKVISSPGQPLDSSTRLFMESRFGHDFSGVPVHLEAAQKGGGEPLSKDMRAYFEPRFGVGFETVRIHKNQQAADAAQSVNAEAFTLGNNIVFGDGKYAPETKSGKKLIAHELTHVIQQGQSSTSKIQHWLPCKHTVLGKYNPDNNQGKHLLAHEVTHVLQHLNSKQSRIQRSVAINTPYPVTEDFNPALQYKKQRRGLGRCEPILNTLTQVPRLKAKKFEKALNLPVLLEKNLDAISRPDLSDSSLDLVRNNLEELQIGSKGKRVKLVQQALIAWGQGLDEPVNLPPQFSNYGYFDKETWNAVILLQEKHPVLKMDGIVGDLTLAELQKEMDNLHGSVFTLDKVEHNDFSGLIHIPPPLKKWSPAISSVDEFFNNKGVDNIHKKDVYKSLAKPKCSKVKKLIILFRGKGSIIPSILAHERKHQDDQVKTITAHLGSWDTRLRIAHLLKLRFKAKTKEKAMKKLFKISGADTPKKLSQKIVKEWIADNIKFHNSPQGKSIDLDLDIISCNVIKFIISK